MEVAAGSDPLNPLSKPPYFTGLPAGINGTDLNGNGIADAFEQWTGSFALPVPDSVTALPEEAAMAAPLLATLPGAINLCGQLSLPEVAACFQRAALYVGNDSGLMHLAAAAGAPTLGLFGPTPAAEYGPSGRCAMAVLSRDGTMAGLPVADALNGAIALLARK